VRQEVTGRIDRLLSGKGHRSARQMHKALGAVMWDKCGMSRNAGGLAEALKSIPALREEFWSDLRVPGSGAEMNAELERAGRVADFLELSELICRDALTREESCGGHFREEHQTDDGEARRDDANFAHVAVWRHRGEAEAPERLVEPLAFTAIALATRSYK